MNNTANIEKVYNLVGHDLSLQDLSLEYGELLEANNISDLKKMNLTDLVKFISGSQYYQNVLNILARILVAKPHSADVERLISTSNILKSIDRQSLSVETENQFLYVHLNMPPLMSWDPRPAIVKWINTSDRRVRHTPKAKQQDWFKGIFEKASNLEKKRDLEDAHQSNKKKNCKIVLKMY
ncbi:E3 SUMO-protein ligase KIAA1586-like [Aphis craccivora]|uniref:E3 SUMO-protein ligase KIAA1586-like n=1 Tax=Aphis craccivora TaxID=307492 RepID=A0A6G0YE61_APHCR|nr:E3 SUMO-protein ligase KIAA1586-like [Aphis craccivora]